MHKYRLFAGFVAALMIAAVSACDRSQDVPDSLSSDPGTASDYQQKLFVDLPKKEQDDVTKAMAALEARLRGDFDTAKANARSSLSIARFADQRLAALAAIDRQLPKLDEGLRQAQAEMEAQQGKGFSAFQLRSMQAKTVTALRERKVQQVYLDLAIKADPVVAEARRRLDADIRTNKITLARTVENLGNLPCAFAPATKPGEGRYVLDGVALGMDRKSATGALCAARNKDLMLVREDATRSHAGDYGDFGFTTKTPLAELPWTMTVPFQSMDASTIRYSLGKPYQSSVRYCLGCPPDSSGRPEGQAQLRNNIMLRFLPDGRVAGMTRTQIFQREVPKPVVNGVAQAAWEPAPLPLKVLLAPLQQQLGPPSFIWSSGERPVFGWVFPAGASALPQEKWYLTRTVTGALMQVNAPGQIFDGETFSRKKLIAAQPRAGYCMARHTDAWGTSRYPLRKYFSYDTAWARDEAFVAARAAGKTMAGNTPVEYNTRYEAPGFVDRCGVVVIATFAKDAAIDDTRASVETAFLPLTPDAPIHRLTVTMIDTDAARTHFVAEEKAVRAQMPVSEVQVTAALSGVTPRATMASREVARQLASQRKGRDYGIWKTCLYQRLRRTFEYEDEVRCQTLDPQGTVPKRP